MPTIQTAHTLAPRVFLAFFERRFKSAYLQKISFAIPAARHACFFVAGDYARVALKSITDFRSLASLDSSAN
jgi:hypothetical protein